MSPFRKKNLLPPQRVCFRLREVRLAQGVSLEELSRRTKISVRHLLALEECRFADIPYATVYQKNFIKCYAQALQISPETFLAQFATEEMPPTKKGQFSPLTRVNRRLLSNVPLFIRSISVGLMVGAFLFYLGNQVKVILEPPRLDLYSPTDGRITNVAALLVQGKTDAAATVSINGQAIKTNTGGEFQEEIHLQPGINTIIVRAKKKHGKETAETRNIIMRETPQFSLNNRGPETNI